MFLYERKSNVIKSDECDGYSTQALHSIHLHGNVSRSDITMKTGSKTGLFSKHHIQRDTSLFDINFLNGN